MVNDLLERAHIEAAKKQWRNAGLLLDVLPRAYRGTPSALRIRATCALELGDLATAERFGKRVKATLPDDPFVLVLAAKAAERRHQGSRALAAWRQVANPKRAAKAKRWLLNRSRGDSLQTVGGEVARFGGEPHIDPRYELANHLLARRDHRSLVVLEQSLIKEGGEGAVALASHIRAAVYFALECHDQVKPAAELALAALARLRLGGGEPKRQVLELEAMVSRSRTAMGGAPKSLRKSIVPADYTPELWAHDLDTGWPRAPKPNLKAATDLLFSDRSAINTNVLFIMLPLLQGDADLALQHLDIVMVRQRNFQALLDPEVAFAAATVYRAAGDHNQSAAFLSFAYQRFALAPPWPRGAPGTLGFADLSPGSLPQISDGPLVTVSVDATGAPRHLNRALESLRLQTYRNLEILVYDNGRKSEAHELLRQSARLDPRIIVVDPSEPADGRNETLSLARGELFACHNADHWAHPQRIETHVAAMQSNEGLVASTSQAIHMDALGQVAIQRSGLFCSGHAMSAVFKTSDIRRDIGFYDRVRSGAEQEHCSRLVDHYGPARLVRLRAPLTVIADGGATRRSPEASVWPLEDYSPALSAYRRSALQWREAQYEAGSLYLPRRPPLRPFEAPIEILL